MKGLTLKAISCLYFYEKNRVLSQTLWNNGFRTQENQMKKIEFCPDCGRVLSLREREWDFLMIGSCRCGFFKEMERGSLPSEKMISSEKGQGVLEKENETEGFPHTCIKCGCEEADVSDLGASYSDESNIYLFRCRKCGYVGRDADGSGNK